MARPFLTLTILTGNESPALSEDSQLTSEGQPPWLLGRASYADLVIEDLSVSREHARIARGEGGRGWRVENVSAQNGVFVDGASVEAGGAVEVSAGEFVLQLGRIVGRVSFAATTVPYQQLIDPEQFVPSKPSKSATECLLSLQRDGDFCAVRWRGKLVTMKASSALVLYALCQRPGEVIHGWDLTDTMGVEYDLPQAISGLRRAFRGLMEDNTRAREEIIAELDAQLASVDRADLEAMDHGALMRTFITSRRGHGYGIMLSPQQVSAEEIG